LSVVVADPDPLARSVLIDALVGSRLQVVGEAETLAAAVEAARDLSPRLVLLAAAFPGLTTTQEAIREMHQWAPGCAVVITELPSADLDPVTAFHAGAAGYVVKDGDMGRWLAPMLRRYARDGVAPITPGVSDEVIKELQEARTIIGSDVTEPSDREVEVLDLIGTGLTNREIAQALGVSSSTAKTHVHNLLRKLQLSNRVQLALYARAQNRKE